MEESCVFIIIEVERVLLGKKTINRVRFMFNFEFSCE